MKLHRPAGLFTLLLLASCANGPSQVEVDRLRPHLDAGVRAIAEHPAAQAGAFEIFVGAMLESATSAGAADLVRGVELDRKPEPGNPVASRVLRAFVVARYGERMLSDLQQLIAFRTVHEEGRDNWDAPEFLRQREWLRSRAEGLGLGFRSVDGRVEEIVADGGRRVLGLLTHGDVQDVTGQTWSNPPWEGRRIDDRIVGRGSEDDKGPIVTSIYVLATLLESGWVDDVSLRLMVANGEECCWDEIPYYLERVNAPDVTIGIDASYPVTHAQKAWGVIDISTPAPARPIGYANQWELVSVDGGSGLSIIPEQAEVRLHPPRGTASTEIADLAARAATWATEHPPARLEVSTEDDLVLVRALGRGGHSSQPESGHNAFGDLTRFLFEQATGSIRLAESDLGLLVQCTGLLVGTETDGQSLGIAHDDEVMGPLTTNLALFDQLDATYRARINIRVPRGIEPAAITDAVNRRLGQCTSRWDVPFLAELTMPSPPHFVSPDGPLVQTLLEVWTDVTGQPGEPVAIGGGTQSRLFPDGVDFGPALAMERYRGHGADEYITVNELHRNAELTIAALWALAAQDAR